MWVESFLDALCLLHQDWIRGHQKIMKACHFLILDHVANYCSIIFETGYFINKFYQKSCQILCLLMSHAQ
jgi:hypothetical protein